MSSLGLESIASNYIKQVNFLMNYDSINNNKNISTRAIMPCSRSIDLATKKASPYQHHVAGMVLLFENLGGQMSYISTCSS